MNRMDAVDQKQQDEIEELKRANDRQHSYVIGMFWLFALTTIIQFSSFIALIMSKK